MVKPCPPYCMYNNNLLVYIDLLIYECLNLWLLRKPMASLVFFYEVIVKSSKNCGTYKSVNEETSRNINNGTKDIIHWLISHGIMTCIINENIYFLSDVIAQLWLRHITWCPLLWWGRILCQDQESWTLGPNAIILLGSKDKNIWKENMKNSNQVWH